MLLPSKLESSANGGCTVQAHVNKPARLVFLCDETNPSPDGACLISPSGGRLGINNRFVYEVKQSLLFPAALRSSQGSKENTPNHIAASNRIVSCLAPGRRSVDTTRRWQCPRAGRRPSHRIQQHRVDRAAEEGERLVGTPDTPARSPKSSLPRRAPP